MITGTTRVYALVGRPVAHSLSPAIYNALFAQDGIDAVYVALDVAPEHGGRVADAVRTLGLAGVNLTVPHKSAIVPHLDEATAAVAITGAANVVVRDGERLIGDNTDGDGFCRAFEAESGPIPLGRAVILGAGGAARAVAAALAGRGVREIVLLSRATAVGAAAHLGAGIPGTRFVAGSLDVDAFAEAASSADLVVNALPSGGRAAAGRLDVAVLPQGAVWVDLNYWDPDPPGIAACRARGLRVQEGLGMLVHQAALAYEQFTGRMPDPVLIRGRLG